MKENKFLKRITSLKDSVKNKMDSSGDSKQARALVRIVQFFIVMVVLTIVSRGTQGATLAVVGAVSPESGEISEDLSFDAGVVARNAGVIEAPKDIVIKEIFVGKGQKVSVGDSIARFDTEDLGDKLIREQAKLEELSLNKSILGQSDGVDDTSKKGAQVGIARSIEDYETQLQENKILIERAEKEVKEANEKLVEAKKKAEKEAKKKGLNNDSPDGLSNLNNNDGDWQQIDPDTGTPIDNDTDDNVDPTESEKKALEQAKQNLEDVKRTAEKNANSLLRSIEDAERNLDSAELSLYKQWKEANNDSLKNAITAKTTQADIVKQQKVVDTLTSIIENDGVLFAESDGVVLAVAVEVGQRVGESGEIAKITTEGGGFAAEIKLDKKQAKKVDVNMPVVIKSDKQQYDAVISSMSSNDETGDVTAVISLPDKEWKISDTVKVDIQISKNKYNLCLPVESIFSDSNGSYVLVIEEHNTILGMQKRLVKVTVNVLVTGKTNVAIEGAITKDMKIVKTSNKPVAAGNNVRVSE